VEFGLAGRPQPGNRFVSFAPARGGRCLEPVSLKRHPGPFPFALLAVGDFPFCFWPW